MFFFGVVYNYRYFTGILAFYKGKFKTFFELVIMIFPPIATGFLLLYVFGRNS